MLDAVSKDIRNSTRDIAGGVRELVKVLTAVNDNLVAGVKSIRELNETLKQTQNPGIVSAVGTLVDPMSNARVDEAMETFRRLRARTTGAVEDWREEEEGVEGHKPILEVQDEPWKDGS